MLTITTEHKLDFSDKDTLIIMGIIGGICIVALLVT
jgi:hypothetical protein